MEDKNSIDRNLTPQQLVWKRRRVRWNAWQASQRLTWAQAVQQGREREFLKREGEGD